MRRKNGEKTGLTMRDWRVSPIEDAIQRECAAGVFQDLEKPENKDGLEVGDIAQIRLEAKERVLKKLR